MDLADNLQAQLAELERLHLRRQLLVVEARDHAGLVVGGRRVLDFASNDYLGLSRHPALIDAALRATRQFGAGAAASRLISGSLAPHGELETALAAFEGSEAALSFSSGYAAATGTIPALLGPGDFVILDRLAHASLIDGARLSRARLRVFRHNDAQDLDRILRWANEQRAGTPGPRRKVVVVTESVFSMDGDRAPLVEILGRCEEREAWLMVDEAHATGVLGPGRRGWAEALGLTGRIHVPMGTLGKALGASGGFIAGSRALCGLLIHRARSFMFSTAPPPAAAAAATAALRILASEEGATLAGRLWERVAQLHRGLVDLGLPDLAPTSPILPLTVGAEEDALRLARALLEAGCLVPAIRYPTVARGKARLRIVTSAAHRDEDVAEFLARLREALDDTGVRPMSNPAFD